MIGIFGKTSKPDGTLRKLTDVTKLNALGWKHQMELQNGIEELYNWYKNTSQGS